eukprot:161995_1
MSAVRYTKLILLAAAGLYVTVWLYKNYVAVQNLYEVCEEKTETDEYHATQTKNKAKKKPKAKQNHDNDNDADEQKVNLMSDIPRFPVQVFVRMRPLVGLELSNHHQAVQHKVKKSKKKQTQTLILKNVFGRNNDRDKPFRGFKKIILPSHNNIATFKTCIISSQCFPSIFVGQRICAFAYGHTGSGKTHTIFGYREDNVPGMYQLFASRLFEDTRIKDADDIFIEVRFTELYQKKLRDLLSDTRQECFVREDEYGEVRIRADPVKCDDGQIKQYPITAIRVQSVNELIEVVSEGIQLRNVGHSSLHDKSSRSHAFLEFEIVSTQLIETRKLLIDKEAELLNYELKIEGGGSVQIRKEIQEIKGRLNSLRNDRDRAYVGGTMVFVDLAGNEYGRDVVNSSKQEERERKEINKSLMALKECIRGLHNKKAYVGYRNSKLTMYLRNYLRGEKSKAIMISNIGSSQEYAKQTINTLQYSQLVAKA